ncbi:hypothetical protein [Hoeflea sp.]|uniref:hypothetical protein n=1 Tax=Hoeflea sp. TaxID=1940281 RepID=UPI003BB16692
MGTGYRLGLVLILAGFAAGCGAPRPEPLAQNGLGLAITPTGLSLVGASQDPSEDISQGSCSSAIATIGAKRVRPTTVTRGMTSCDLYFLKGQPASIQTSGVNFRPNDNGIANKMVITYLENGVEKRYVFIENLLDRVE